MAGHTTLMVTGTHGKTTTTSMLIVALQHCGLDPSFAVGGELGEAGTNAHHGSGDCFVAEADESDGSLLEYTPNVAVVTNIEADHLDFFGSAEAYVAVFDAFVERLAPGGALVVCTDDPGAAALAERAAALGMRVLRYGSRRRADDTGRRRCCAGNSRAPARSRTSAGRRAASAGDAVVGARPAHGAQRAGGAAGRGRGRRAGRCGARRAGRFRRRAAPVRVGRHAADRSGCSTTTPITPPRSRATLAAVRTLLEQSGRRPRAGGVSAPLVFADKGFRREFGQALDAADVVFVLDVYGAREQPMAGISGASVAEHVSVPVQYVPDFSAVADRVAGSARPGDVVVTMGAGDVTMLGPEILTALQVRANRSAPGTAGVIGR